MFHRACWMRARDYRIGQHGYCNWAEDEKDEEMVGERAASDRLGGSLVLTRLLARWLAMSRPSEPQGLMVKVCVARREHGVAVSDRARSHTEYLWRMFRARLCDLHTEQVEPVILRFE